MLNRHFEDDAPEKLLYQAEQQRKQRERARLGLPPEIGFEKEIRKSTLSGTSTGNRR